MTTEEAIDREVREELDMETRPLFPTIYEGVREADALAQAEDALLRVLCGAVYAYHQNRNLQTIGSGVAEELEAGLGITPQGTLEQRRAAIMGALRKRSNISIEDLIELARQEGLEDFGLGVRARELELEVYSEEGDAPSEVLLRVRAAIRRKTPQNLRIAAEDMARGDIEVTPYITRPLVCLFADAGHAVPAGNRNIARGGILTAQGDTAWTTPEWGDLTEDEGV